MANEKPAGIQQAIYNTGCEKDYSLDALGAAGAGAGAAAAGALSVVVVTGAGAAVLELPL
jgi:hypothetical protein